MIILFSSSLGLTAAEIKRKQLDYIDALIYLGARLNVLLSSTMPETGEIMRILRSDSRLKGVDFDGIYSPFLTAADNERVATLISCIGRYDIDSQLCICREFTEYFRLLKKSCFDYYERHYRLYISFGIMGGVIVSVLLI